MRPPPFWYALTDSDRARLRAVGTLHVHPAQTEIVRERQASDFAIVLLEGCVKVCTLGVDGYQVILGLRDAGDLVGELAGIDGGPRSATLLALTTVEALHLPADALRGVLGENPAMAAAVQRIVTARLREADRLRAAAGARTPLQRLADLLLHLGQRYGAPDEDGHLLIDLPLSQPDLAGLILTSQRTLARLLDQLRGQKVLTTGRRRILLRDQEALRRLAGD